MSDRPGDPGPSSPGLLSLLVAHLGQGKLPSRDLVAALRAVVGVPGEPPTRRALLEALSDRPEPEVVALTAFLRSLRFRDAQRVHEMQAAGQVVPADLRAELAGLRLDIPAPGAPSPEAAPLEDAAALLEIALPAHDPAAAGARAAVERALEAQDVRARAAALSLARGEAAAGRGLDPRTLAAAAATAFGAHATRAEQQALLDTVLASPVDVLADVLPGLCQEPWAQERAALVLTIRFGTPYASDWAAWTAWFGIAKTASRARVRHPSPGVAAQRLLVWVLAQPSPDPAAVAELESRSARGPGIPPPPPPLPVPVSAPPSAAETPPGVERTLPTPAASSKPMPRDAPSPRPPPAPPPAPPSPWREHVQGFLSENAYMAAGIVMVVVGASLLAYFTWDKHWLLRYTIMPGLLFVFTTALGRAARWLEARDASLRDTGATLRAAGVLLLPVNFMALALLAGDAEVTHKAIALPAMSIVYLGLAGSLLFGWCGGVDPRLVPFLPLSLLAVDALVLLRPAAVHSASGTVLLLAGFHVGFLVVAGAVVRFARRVLDAAMARESRVPVFVGATLALTFLEVFVLVHGPAAHRPPLHSYAALPVLAGGLVPFVERRFLALRGGRLSGESFLGYALVLLGILMGGGDPQMRIVTLVLAGVVWLVQAGERAEPLHHWVGMVLLVLGGASVGLLPDFPGPQLPILGVVLGLLVGLAGVAAGDSRQGQLRAACLGLQPTVLVLSTAVAVLAQWHYRSDPQVTAATILVIAGLLAFRAWRDQTLALVHTVAVHFALVLPYLGFVDMGQRTLRGNTLPFGFALLSWGWIALVAARPARLLREARSTVLFLYGALALAAMALRVLVEGRLAAPASLAVAYPEHLGPLLMAGALACATWWTRSLVPAAMASVLLVILFPALKANLQASFPALGWGTGFGSAFSALALVLASFRLREAPSLRNLEGGDLLFGQAPFPFRRFDHTLFTAPLLASALFLIVRVDTFTLVSHLDLVPLKTAAALVVTAAGWMLLAAYWRERSFAPLLVQPGWVALSLGIWFGYARVVVGDFQEQWPLALALGVLQILELSFHHVVAARYPWAETVLAAPLRGVCRLAGLLLSLGLIVGLVAGAPLDDARVLAAVGAVQLARTAVGAPSMGAGTSLAGLAYVVLLAAAAPGRAPLADRLGVDGGLTESLGFVIAVQLLQAFLERAPSAYVAIRPILRPAQALATGLAFALGVFGVVDAVTGPTLTAPQQGLVLLGTVLVARAHSSGAFSLIATGLLYLVTQRSALALLGASGRSDYLCDPLRLSAWALGLAVVAVLGRKLEARVPGLLSGRDPLPFLAGPVQPFLHTAAVLASLVAAGRHTFVEELRQSTHQLLAPWLGAATTIIVGWFSGPYLLYWVAVGLTSLGNVHAVRLFWGEPLRGGGVSEVHLVAVGLGLTLLEGTVLRRLWRDEGVQAFVNRASLAVAGLILALLTTNYAAHPDLAAMSAMRFLVSGVMALAAGLYFRRAARHPGPGEEAHVDLCEGLYHFGLATAAWCTALLVPWFRQPPTVLLALGVPALGFWMRAELEPGETGKRFRTSAAVLGFLLLGLYALRPVFQMVLFPRAVIETDHYHYYAGLAMAVGVLLLRLHGLGGTSWLAFYGGLALISGSYFALTAWPVLSPFADDRIPAAWCAVGLAHFWTLASAWRSPLRGFLQEVAGLGEPAWLGLRASWGRFVLFASQVVVFLGLVDAGDGNTYAAAPLLLGAASVFIHHAVLYASAWRWQAGLLLVALALHADFVVPSTLQRDDVVWALLVIWAGVLVVPGWLRRPLRNSVLGVGAAVLAALVFVQVLYHHAGSQAGLLAMAAGAVLAALTPRDRHAPVVPEEKLASALLLAVPTWLVYFWTAPLLDDRLALFDTRAVLLTAASLFLTGLFARGPAVRWERTLASRAPRLISQAVALASRNGSVLHVNTMLFATGAAFVLQVVRYDRPFDRMDVLLFLVLYAGLAASWYREGQRRRASPAFFAAEACLVFAFAVVRRQLMLTAAGWTYEHDIWASLGVSLLLAGSKQVLDEREAELRAPFLISVLGLPVLALVWTLVHHLGVDLALLVVGLHSLMFAYLGRDRADSPYNLVATSGFVAFVLMVFWTKLELRVLHAYVIPVGLGILVLLQLFGRDLPSETRNRIRLVTLLAMLGSAGYYALVDDRHPVPFNLTLLALCLAAMALGSFLRIRLYVVLGLAGVLVDLASIVTKVLVRLDRGERMTSVGVLVLVLGGALVSGAIYYKTHRDLIEDWLTGWRRRLGAWE